MTVQFHFYTDIFNNINNALISYVGNVSASVMASFTPVATTMLAIYVAFWGWSMMRGVISEPVIDGVGRMIRLTTITAIALNVGHYNTFVADFLWKSPDALAKVVTGGSGDSSVLFLDKLMQGIYQLGEVYWQKANSTSGLTGIPDIGMIFIALLIWLFGLWATGMAAFFFILSKMALAILLAVGPVFILGLIFEPTKRFFDAWMGQVCNFVFLVMLTAASAKLILAILNSYLTNSGAVLSNPGVGQAFPALVLCAIAGLVMMQMPSIASALGGGVAVSTLGAVGWAYNKGKDAAGAGRDLASGRTLNKMRAARRERHVNKQWAQRNPGVTARATKAIYQRVAGNRANQVRKAN
ncbi:type IV secretion system protein [Undibacterium sp.]|uniref:type IV secretion system protein n=1 Tax=Undibacterium sp. TaxID=1914977 RepID=UPI003753D5FC